MAAVKERPILGSDKKCVAAAPDFPPRPGNGAIGSPSGYRLGAANTVDFMGAASRVINTPEMISIAKEDPVLFSVSDQAREPAKGSNAQVFVQLGQALPSLVIDCEYATQEQAIIVHE